MAAEPSVWIELGEVVGSGIDLDTSMVALDVNTPGPPQEVIRLVMPVARLAQHIAHLMTLGAATAQQAAQAAGANADTVRAAMLGHAFPARVAGLAGARPDGSFVTCFVGDGTMPPLPIELTRDAAQALFSSLGDFLAS